MKNMSKQKIFRIGLALTTIITTAIVYSQLPERIPMHWNINWEIDNWGSRNSIWFLLGLIVALTVLLELLPRLDPRYKNYDKFSSSWETIQTVIVGFMTFVYAWQLFSIFNDNNISTAITGRIFISALGVMFMILGNVMGKVRHNYFVGVKTPWALNDPDNWQKTQRVGGWSMFGAGVAFVIAAIFGGGYVPVFIISILTMIVVPMVYSYWIFRQKSE